MNYYALVGRGVVERVFRAEPEAIVRLGLSAIAHDVTDIECEKGWQYNTETGEFSPPTGTPPEERDPQQPLLDRITALEQELSELKQGN